MSYTDQIKWPNGAGYTPCTPEYADAVSLEQALMAELSDMVQRHEAGRRPAEYARLYERAHRAADHVLKLQAAGHLGQGRCY